MPTWHSSFLFNSLSGGRLALPALRHLSATSPAADYKHFRTNYALAPPQAQR